MENLNVKNIIDVEEKNFAKEVIEASQEKLVMVDFWAPWCGPCKQLSPLLEEIANENKGKILIAKVNIDENQQIAAQLRIQSIPMVFAFKNKQIVDGFQGLIPKQKIIEFINKNIGEEVGEDFSFFFEEVKILISNKDFEDAAEKLAGFLAEHSDNVEAISLYIDCLGSLSKYDDVNEFIKSLSEDIIKKPEIASSISNIEIKKSGNLQPAIEELEKKYNLDKKNINNLISLSEKYYAEGSVDHSFELLINNYTDFKSNDQQIIKETLVKYFNALGANNNYTKIYRKKFSGILFS